MLAKKNRLNLKNPQNRELLKTGKRYQSSNLPLQARFDFKGNDSQINVLLTKKFVANASLRVALKREILNIIPREILGTQGLRMIILLNRKIDNKFNKEELEDFFTQLTKQING